MICGNGLGGFAWGYIEFFKGVISNQESTDLG